MLLSQIRVQDDKVQVVARDGTEAYVIRNCRSTYDLALDCANQGVSLKNRIGALGLGPAVDVEGALAAGDVLAPVHHPDPTQMFLSGAGLIRTESVVAMQRGNHDWLFKGNGYAVGAPGMDLVMRECAGRDHRGPAIAAIYVINNAGLPFRIGFAHASDFSDLALTTDSYLRLMQATLRHVAFGPELLLGDLPQAWRGTSRISRNNGAVYEKSLSSNDQHVVNCIVKMENDHFTSDVIRQPGQLHIHIIATATAPFADEFVLLSGDHAEVAIPQFGLPLRNSLRVATLPETAVHVRAL
ncbi:hypothetical protein [Yoonia sp.]|uniref:hypothetical protein n=1 Tax=Yoonia sp. TaxID=2212373 RepID=UPI00391BD184